MAIVRRDDQVALNDLIVACREAASCHADAAEVTADASLAEQLGALAKDRGATADELAEVVLDDDDVPNAPSAESELLTSAAVRLKSAFAEDEAAQLLSDCEDKEERVVETATILLGHDLDDRMRQSVTSLRSDAASRIAKLREKHASSQAS